MDHYKHNNPYKKGCQEMEDSQLAFYPIDNEKLKCYCGAQRNNDHCPAPCWVMEDARPVFSLEKGLMLLSSSASDFLAK